MGKEWFNWGGSGKSGRRKRRGVGEDEETVAPGCMGAVFQLLNLHYFPIALRHRPQSSLKPPADAVFFRDDEPTVLKGLEAPRNSLELEESFIVAASSSSTQMRDKDLNVQASWGNQLVGIQIKTSCQTKSPGASTSSSSKAKAEGLSSAECSSSPGTRTPKLVARLMGLDLLPETTSPSLSSISATTSNRHLQSKNQKQNHHSTFKEILQSYSSSKSISLFDKHEVSGTLSLPETPRMSSCRRSDVEHHRLSLQLHKENLGEEVEFSAFAAKKQSEKTVRERVSRKFGLDMTNTIKCREYRRDSNVVDINQPKNQTTTLTSVGDEFSAPKPRVRFSDTKNQLAVATSLRNNEASQSPWALPGYLSTGNQPEVQKPTNVTDKIEVQVQLHQRKSAQSSNRVSKPPQAYDAAIRSKKEEPFIHSPATNKANVLEKKPKKTLLSSDVVNISFPSNPQSDKQGPKQSSQAFHDSPSRRLKSTQLPSCSSRWYQQHHQATTSTPHVFQENIQVNRSSSSIHESQHYRYIQRILKRTGIDKTTPVSSANWYSTSHPLDPSTFHFLELLYPATADRCQRKLIFHLVDELLNPYVNIRLLIGKRNDDEILGSELIEILCKKIGSFPAANCQVLEDIDALIEEDLGRSQVGNLHAFEEEGQLMVMDIEDYMVERLVNETAMVALDVAGGRHGDGEL